jgi:hypothetical protein
MPARIGLWLSLSVSLLVTSQAFRLAPQAAFASSVTQCVEAKLTQDGSALRVASHSFIDLAQLERTEQALNDRLVKRFPSLAIVLRDPDQFFATMEARFNERKRLHPDDPYGFDYSEVGMPLVRDMKHNLELKITELERILNDKKQATTLGRLSPKLRKYSTKELQIALKYLADLSKEAEAYVEQGSVSYEKLIHFSSFYGRAVGHFDQRNSTLFQRNFLKVDHRLGGYKQLPIDEEYAMYRKRDFNIFQKGVSFTEHAGSRKLYEEAVFDQQKLRTVMVPTNAELDYDVLQRLMSREKINLLGVTYEPILAEGFLRPAGPFWHHDVRHEAAKYYEKTVYLEKHPGISDHPERLTLLNLLMDQWYFDLFNEMNQIQDKNLREAVKLLVFNHNHDLGYPFAPSDFLNWKPDLSIYLLYFSIRASGQKSVAQYGRPFESVKRARQWLRDFWEKRAPQEAEFLAGISK